MLRSSPCPEKSPSPVFPYTKYFPSPTPLVFTPLKELGAVNSPLPEKPTVGSCLNCDADQQCETLDNESNWENVESEQDSFFQCINLYLHTGNDKMTRCKIFQLDASYSPSHPSNTCSSQTTPPPSPSSHIGREVRLSLFPRALLLCLRLPFILNNTTKQRLIRFFAALLSTSAQTLVAHAALHCCRLPMFRFSDENRGWRTGKSDTFSSRTHNILNWPKS